MKSFFKLREELDSCCDECADDTLYGSVEEDFEPTGDEQYEDWDEINEGGPGLWANIHAKRQRIKAGSGERMREPGSKGAPTSSALKRAAESYEDLDEAKDSDKYTYIDQTKGPVLKGKTGTYVGYTHSATKGKGANILKHNKTKKYYAAGGSSTAFTAKTTLHDTPEAAAKAYHKGNLAEASPMIKPPKNEFGKKEDAFAHAKQHGGKVMKKTFTHPTSGKQTVSYVVKEDAEQIDELKRKTLASYVSKAAGSYGRDKQLIGRTSPDGTMKNAEPELKRAVKNRLTGINRAAERLAKEETEIAEASKETALSYMLKNPGKKLPMHLDPNRPFDPDPPKKNPSALAGKYGQGFSSAKHLAKQGMASVKEDAEQIDEFYSVHKHLANDRPEYVGSPTKFLNSAVAKTLQHHKDGHTVTVRSRDHRGIVDHVTIKPGDNVKSKISSLQMNRKEIDEASKKPNATTRHLRDYPVTDKEMAKPVAYYSLVHKATNKVLSTHKDLESAKDEHRGMDQGERAHYRIATSTKAPKSFSMKEEVGLQEAEKGGRKVQLNKPFRTSDGKGKFAVYTKNEKGNVVKVNFGDTTGLTIKTGNPDRRRNFRARHNCDDPGPRHKARYWACKSWSKDTVSAGLGT